MLNDHNHSQKISVKGALFDLSKIYVIADGARRTLAEIPERSKKIADIFGLKLSLRFCGVKNVINLGVK